MLDPKYDGVDDGTFHLKSALDDSPLQPGNIQFRVPRTDVKPQKFRLLVDGAGTTNSVAGVTADRLWTATRLCWSSFTSNLMFRWNFGNRASRAHGTLSGRITGRSKTEKLRNTRLSKRYEHYNIKRSTIYLKNSTLARVFSSMFFYNSSSTNNAEEIYTNHTIRAILFIHSLHVFLFFFSDWLTIWIIWNSWIISTEAVAARRSKSTF